MSNSNDPSNIVDLGLHQDPRSERVGNLQEIVRDSSVRHLKSLADSMFERVDDALFDLAEKAESNAVQTQYFDGMREVRKKRALVERRFLETVRHSLSDFAAGRLHARAKLATDDSGSAELSLVDDSELEESLAVTSMIGKAQGRLSRQLYAVNRRLSVICGGNEVEDATNPIGPAMLCQAFRQAMHELDVETRVRLIIYKLFDRYVMAGLGTLYSALNIALAQAGVLPKLRHEIPNQSHRQHAPATQRSGATAAADNRGGAMDDADFQAEFYDMLNALLSSRRHDMDTIAPGTPSLSPAELLGALSLLQNEVAVHPASVATNGGDSGMAAQDIAQLKHHLLSQVTQLRGDSRARMSGADEDTIDLVGMLFEYILEDRNLPAEMQVLLARLQIPYLKAAILDRRMFAHTSHPARRLLDALADAAKGWSPEADRDRRLYTRVRTIVESLLQDFDDDMDIFARLEEELADFLSTTRKRAELSEQRVAETVRGREKLQQARRRAAQAILARVDKQELPALVHGILTRAWANYLVLTLLRQGEDSAEFRVGLRFVDDFVWSARPKHNEAERERLRQLLPLLEKSLRHGLATVAFQDADVESLMTQLNAMYRMQLGEEMEFAAESADAEPAAEAPLPIPDSVDAIATPEVAAEADAEADAGDETPLDDDDSDVARVRALKVGNWLEFAGSEDNAGERAKLSWISPISGKYLFVNRRGLKVADKTVAQLAREFASGTAIVLEELPLFDRALDAIVERLRHTQQADDATDTAVTGDTDEASPLPESRE